MFPFKLHPQADQLLFWMLFRWSSKKNPEKANKWREKFQNLTYLAVKEITEIHCNNKDDMVDLDMAQEKVNDVLDLVMKIAQPHGYEHGNNSSKEQQRAPGEGNEVQKKLTTKKPCETTRAQSSSHENLTAESAKEDDETNDVHIDDGFWCGSHYGRNDRKEGEKAEDEQNNCSSQNNYNGPMDFHDRICRKDAETQTDQDKIPDMSKEESEGIQNEGSCNQRSNKRGRRKGEEEKGNYGKDGMQFGDSNSSNTGQPNAEERDGNADVDDDSKNDFVNEAGFEREGGKKKKQGENTEGYDFDMGYDDLNEDLSEMEKEGLVADLSEILKIDRANMKQLIQICEIRGIPVRFLQYNPPQKFILTVPYNEWEKVCDGEKMIKGWPQVIDDALHRLDFPCSFNAKNVTKTASSFTLYGHCGGECKMQFRIDVMVYDVLQPVVLKVSMINPESFSLLQRKSTGRQLREAKRIELQNRLVHEKAYKVFVDLKVKSLSLRFLHNNFPVRNVATLNKARSEKKRKNVVTGYLIEDIGELKIRLESDGLYSSKPKSVVPPGYIRQISHSPFICSLYSPMQIRYSLLTDVWYMDATGSVVKNVHGKQTMLHSILGKVTEKPKVPTVPICEFLLNRSGGVDILPILLTFIKSIRDIDAKYAPKLVCTDFSFPYLHSLAKAWNDHSLIDHINASFTALTGNEKLREDWVHLAICKLHILNGFGRNLNKVNDTIREHAMHGMAKIQEAASFEEFEIAVTHFITLFGCPQLPETDLANLIFEIKHSFLPDNLLHDMTEFLASMTPEIEMEVTQTSSEFKSQREKSEAYKFFIKKEATIVGHTFPEGTKLINNEFYALDVLNAMRDVYFPYVALWTAATPRHLVPEVLSPVHLLSTAPIENYFGKHKNNLHPELRQEITRYVEEHGKLVQGIITNALSIAATITLDNVGTDPDEPTSINDTNKGVHSNSMYDDDANQTAPAPPEYESSSQTKRQKEDDHEDFNNSRDVWSKGSKKSKTLYHNRHRKKLNRPNTVLDEPGTPDVVENMEKVIGKIKRNLNKARKRKSAAQKESLSTSGIDVDTTITIDSEAEDYEELGCVPGTMSLPLLFQSASIKGGEDDLSTICGSSWLNDNVIYCGMELLYQTHCPSESQRCLKRLIDPNTIRWERTSIDDATQYKFVDNIKGLPDLDESNLRKMSLLYPANVSHHWWLVVVHFGTSVIQEFDTKKNAVKAAVKNDFYKTLKALMKVKYRIPQNRWKVKKEEMTQQRGGYECGTLTLASAEAIFLGFDPTQTVIPQGEARYRNKYALLLLESGINGNLLLTSYAAGSDEDTTKNILSIIATRRKARKIKQEISLRLERLQSCGYDDDGVRDELTSLMRELDTFCCTAMITSTSQKYLIYSWDTPNSSVQRMEIEQLDTILGVIGHDIKDIALKKLSSVRYQMFQECNITGLQQMQFRPNVFTDDQMKLLMAYLREFLGVEEKNEGERLLADLVLVPEMQVRVYAYLKRISIGMAEQELRVEIN